VLCWGGDVCAGVVDELVGEEKGVLSLKEGDGAFGE
jgi:hypothetical protein